jgi:hypothetical protein
MRLAHIDLARPSYWRVCVSESVALLVLQQFERLKEKSQQNAQLALSSHLECDVCGHGNFHNRLLSCRKVHAASLHVPCPPCTPHAHLSRRAPSMNLLALQMCGAYCHTHCALPEREGKTASYVPSRMRGALLRYSPECPPPLILAHSWLGLCRWECEACAPSRKTTRAASGAKMYVWPLLAGNQHTAPQRIGHGRHCRAPQRQCHIGRLAAVLRVQARVSVVSIYLAAIQWGVDLCRSLPGCEKCGVDDNYECMLLCDYCNAQCASQMHAALRSHLH